MSAVAEHAGVRRSTLYRHFPDEAALFAACTAHWGRRTRRPTSTQWAAIGDPDERLRSRARASSTPTTGAPRGCSTTLLRDEATVPIVAQHVRPFRDYLDAPARRCSAGRRERGRARRRVHAAIGHALAFSTWQSLSASEGLADDDAVL